MASFSVSVAFTDQRPASGPKSTIHLSFHVSFFGTLLFASSFAKMQCFSTWQLSFISTCCSDIRVNFFSTRKSAPISSWRKRRTRRLESPFRRLWFVPCSSGNTASSTLCPCSHTICGPRWCWTGSPSGSVVLIWSWRSWWASTQSLMQLSELLEPKRYRYFLCLIGCWKWLFGSFTLGRRWRL